MNGKIVAANPRLGMLVVDAGERGYVVLEARGDPACAIGDQVAGELNGMEFFAAQNLTQHTVFEARVQRLAHTRADAVDSVTVF